ncbi:MAG: TIGR04013 family B12-binding domain/radical SAM domain-containing protein [Methanomicrobiales archaeon]|nr:TIGR04013 family B12-binding domain/radical SAM domain-containing protein [Methanomicrobiales archaeon]
MKIHWRDIPQARNSYAALYAACERAGYILHPVPAPEPDITCYSLNSITASRLREEIAGADCITIAGGPHASARYEEVARYTDYVIVGEGEYTLPALVRNLEHGGTGRIPGVADWQGYIPATTTVLLDAYPPFSTMQGYTEITRGCPQGCAYCQTPRLFGCSMRHRSIDAIVASASRHRDQRFVSPNALAYGSDGIYPRLDKVEKLLARLQGMVYFGTFPSEVRPEFVSDAALSLITKYCANTRLHFGGQSGSDRVLAEIHRGHSVGDIVHAVELCREHGLTPVVDFILGFPFETDEDQQETLQLIRWVVRHGQVHLHTFFPLPGTPLEGMAPRPLIPEAHRILGRLSLEGKLTGFWGGNEVRFLRRGLNNGT